jgi:zinc protease
MTAQTIDRTKPPETAALPAFKLPPVFETTLPNGLQVLLVEDRRFPLVTLRLGFQAGAKFEPKDLPGLAAATGALLTEGTKTRASRQIAEELAAIGGTLSGLAGADALTLAGNSLAENLPALLDLAADVTLNASFPDDEIKIYKNKRTQELLAQRSEASFWADEKLAAAVFGEHPYARLNPTPDSIAALNREQLTAFRDSLLAPNNASLILLGALPVREETLKLVREKFGGWQRRDLPPPPVASFPKPARSLLLVDRPGSVQADIRVGQLAVNRSDPAYFPLVVANTILGGGASSRMFTNIREKEGFAYDAHSSLQPRREAGLFTAVTQVRNEVIEPALKAVEAELSALANQPVAAEELSDVKNYLSGVFIMGLETQNGLANQLNTVRLMGLPNDYLEKYTACVRSVEPPEIQAAARKYMAPETAGIVVVGDASQLAKPLEKFGKPVVVKAE